MTDSNIRTAVAAWFADQSAAEAMYGHISTWVTSEVTDMSYLFSACDWDSRCNSAAASFNEDISAWSVDNVRDMHWMFGSASSFNQDIGGWSVEQVTDMHYMFNYASAFSQNLNWCVGDDVNLDEAFSGTLCAPTSCGVQQRAAGSCAPSPAPTTIVPTISAAPTMDVCPSIGEFDYGNRTLYCFEAGGEIHNVLRVEDEQTTCRHTDENSCPDGFDIWVPRNYEHLQAVYSLARDWWPHEDWRAYEMMNPVGVYRDEDGCGSCHDYAMNSEAMADYDGVGWRSIAGDPWFLRSTGGVDDHGGYEAGCWVGTHHHWDQGLASYASGCNNCCLLYTSDAADE